MILCGMTSEFGSGMAWISHPGSDTVPKMSRKRLLIVPLYSA